MKFFKVVQFFKNVSQSRHTKEQASSLGPLPSDSVAGGPGTGQVGQQVDISDQFSPRPADRADTEIAGSGGRD